MNHYLYDIDKIHHDSYQIHLNELIYHLQSLVFHYLNTISNKLNSLNYILINKIYPKVYKYTMEILIHSAINHPLWIQTMFLSINKLNHCSP